MLSRNASFDSKSSVNQNSPIRASDTKWSPLHVTPPVSPFRTGSFSRSYPKLELSRKRSASENVPIPPCEASQLLEFRKFLPPELSCDIVTTAIMEYAEPHRFGVVCKPETSKEDTEKMVMRFYGVTIEADTTTNTIQTAKYWFLPGWFLMPGAHGVVLRVNTLSGKEHFFLVTAFSEENEGSSKYEARAFDSGRSIRLGSRDDIEKYLHINGYTDACPMAVAYPRSNRSNSVITNCLDICQVFYDLFMIQMPPKASEQRQFISNRNRYLGAYFEKVEDCDIDQLRFKSEFLLSQPTKFPEHHKYEMSMLSGQEDAKSEVSGEDDEPLQHLKEFVEALPIYRYKRKRLKYPGVRAPGV